MTKYGTYKIFKHKVSGELRRLRYESSEDIEKIAKLKDERCWIELEEDPENNKATDGS
jgi:hypothetical protein